MHKGKTQKATGDNDSSIASDSQDDSKNEQSDSKEEMSSNSESEDYQIRKPRELGRDKIKLVKKGRLQPR